MELMTRYITGYLVPQVKKLMVQLRARKKFSKQPLSRAEDFIRVAAENGLFINRAYFPVFLQEIAFSSMNLSHFEQKEYHIRYAVVADREQLLALEQRCWTSELWADPVVVEHRLLNHPRGQFVLELNGTIIGVLYTQRICHVEDVDQASACSVEQQHDANGAVIQLLSLLVDPDYQQSSYGEVLRDFVLLVAMLTPEIKEVIGVTRCQRYAENKKYYPNIIDYIYALDEAGLPLDPTLSFHVSGGASIEREIQNYRPKDINNQGTGVLIRYDINALLAPTKSKKNNIARARSDISSNTPSQSETTLKQLIYSLIQRQMPEESMNEFHADTPLLLLGIDSLSLIQLRHQLNQALNLNLDSDIFFRYPTATDLLQHLAADSSLQKTSRVKQEKPTISPPKEISIQSSVAIAITGLALRFPKANSSQEYWTLLQQDQDVISRVPQDRWSQEIDAVPYGGFIEDIDCFDANFFDISAAEAKHMDPQQRLLLEVTWHALESANINPKNLKGKRVGVFIGQFSHDYELLQTQAKDSSVYYATGTSSSVSAGRLSYFLGSQGPTITLDTACSSSLVAVHLAQKSLQHGECDIAIVGGVNALLAPQLHINFTRLGMLAADGHCKTFDESADGYVRSEGCGVLILHRLEEAQKKQHSILAIIKGSAINHDGASNGLTAPNGLSQEELLKQALNDASLNANDIDYIEAHGTGTRLGDPIELNAIKSVFANNNRKKPLIVGTAKTHVGHLEAAAGMAGLIKTILSLQYQRIPKLLHFNTLNSQIELGEHVRLAVEVQEWKITEDHTRRAGISSFGFSGTNAHVILEEAPEQTFTTIHKPYFVITLSGKTIDVLQRKQVDLLTWLNDQNNTTIPLSIISYTLNQGRSHFTHRAAWVVDAKETLKTELEKAIVNKESDNYFYEVIDKNNKPKDDAIYTQVLKNSLEGLNQAITNKKAYREMLSALANLYVKGYSIDWELLHQGEPKQRVSLPTYPFAKIRYWVSESTSSQINSKEKVDRLHPFVHRNTSTISLQRFESIFNGKEFFLRDHVIAGNPLLPGVAYLEMARAAGELAGEQAVMMIKDILWLKPLHIDTHAEKVCIHLYPRDEVIDYEIILDKTDEIHSSGKLYFSKDKKIHQSIDIAEIKNKVRQQKMQTEIYTLFAEKGLHYGPSFQGIKTLYYSTTEVLAELSLPSNLGKENSGYYLHPSIMDAALQACLGLTLAHESTSLPAMVPFSLKTLQIIQPTSHAAFAYVRAQDVMSTDKILRANIDLVDRFGNSVVVMEGFMAMPLTSVPHKKLVEQSALLYAHPVWLDQAIEQNKAQSPNIVICVGIENYLIQTLKDTFTQTQFISLPIATPFTADSIQAVFIHVFLQIKTLFSGSLKKTQTLLIVLPEHAICYAASLTGLVKTARLENNKLQGKVITCSENMNTVEALQVLLQTESDPASFNHSEVRYLTKSQRQILYWQKVALESSPDQLLLKPQGVYLITGGLGGLGEMIAQHLGEREKITLILMGRSALTKANQLKLDKLTQKNIDAYYVQVDISQSMQLKEAIEKINATHGAIHGIIHSAGIIKDSLMVNKTEAEISDVFKAKIMGTLALDEATQDQPLDFVVYFSSISGVAGNVGQADYAGANAFLNRFAEYRNNLVHEGKRQGKTYAIAWPLWQEGGMQMDAQAQQRMAQQSGLVVLPTPQGMEAFDQILSQPQFSTLCAAMGDQEKIIQFLNEFNLSIEVTKQSETSVQQCDVEQDLITICVDVLKLRIEDVDLDAEFQEYGVDSIAMMSMLNRIEALYGKPINPNGFVEYPTIKSFARYLIENNIAREIKKESNAIEKISVAQTAGMKKPFSRFSTKKRNVTHQKVAIIASSCRLPGAKNLEAFWDNLANGVDAIREVPADRWNKAAFYDEIPENPDKTYTNHGGFIDDISYFDAGFFGISEEEALTLDPQHRIILELAAELWARAGYTKEEVSGSNTSIFIGGKDNNYLRNLYHYVPASMTQHTIVNSIGNMMAARISDFYNLTGSAKCIDTACSSSLVAVHEACQSILRGESEMAIAGGISLLIDPFSHIGFSQAKVLSADGKSYVFDERAQGFVLGEGAGLVLLKDYDAAIRDGDQIQAVILGSAVNNDGKTMGLTVPNLDGQKAVIEQVLKLSQIHPESISYLEAHGTGTLLGDPIEIKAATEVYRSYTQVKQYCAVGSVKSNVGHTLMAAGVTSLIKVILSLQHQQIPATLHCEKPHPRFGFEASPFYPNTALKEWGKNDTPRRAAISSFGFGGTNCHMIVEESKQASHKKAFLLPSFHRKPYWLGKQSVKKNIDYADIIQQLKNNIISTEMFKEMIERIESE